MSIFNSSVPILLYLSLFIEEYVEIIWAIKDGDANKIFLKGSRSSGKTYFVVLFITLDMMIHKNTSWIVVMENKTDHSDRTMNEFQDTFDRLDERWLGFSLRWEKKDGQSVKEWRYNRTDGSYGVIRFIGIDELTKSGMTPPPKNIWRGKWEEEGSTSDQQFGGDIQRIREKYDGHNTFKGTAIRYLTQKRRNPENLGFVEFYSFNPYWEENPRLDRFKIHHPDNFEQLKIFGYTSHIQKDIKEMYITSNWRVNTFVNEDPNMIEFFETMEKTNWRKALIESYGMTGTLQNSAYEPVFHIQEELNENFKPSEDYEYFVITNDIGGGNAPTTLVLLGKCNFTKKWYTLEEWGDEELTKGQAPYDPMKTHRAVILKVIDWEKKYPQLKRERTQWFMDNDAEYKANIIRAIKELEENNIGLNSEYNLLLFKEKYKTRFDKKNRVKWVEYTLASRNLVILKDRTPIVYRQYKNSKMKLGKLVDGDDDYRDAVDMGIFWLMFWGEIINQKDLKVNKDIKSFAKELGITIEDEE